MRSDIQKKKRAAKISFIVTFSFSAITFSVMFEFFFENIFQNRNYKKQNERQSVANTFLIIGQFFACRSLYANGSPLEKLATNYLSPFRRGKTNVKK